MRCTNCGWPLSPLRTMTNCPRCGAAIGSNSKPQPVFAPYENGHPEVSGPIVGISRAQTGPVRRINRKSNTRLGFSVAALCVITGGLLLIFVYFLGMSGSGGSPNASTGSLNTQSMLVSPTPASPSPSPTNTPTPTAIPFPGQQYIDHAQMASAIDAKTELPTQLSTTFAINTRIYVTFQLHPPVHGGAVCLLWYLNGRQVTNYQFAVSQYTHNSYSYAIYGSAGPASVEVYWASSTSCVDEQLAQRLNFTVTI
ncbi:MAG TPA: hypothetical protein VFA09_12105 [Ktedonobacteraceae bacterium]|nr:hypothetical protein [Ktedonobacteraceae bacterium]